MGFFRSLAARVGLVGNRKGTTLDELIRTSGGATSLSSTAMSVTTTTAQRLVTVAACARVLAESVASLPVHVYRRRADGGKDKDTSHPLHKLLRVAPNEWQTAYEFIEMLTGHVALRGNGYAFINRVGGEPRELLPLPPDSVTVEKMGDHRVVYRVTQDGGGTREFGRDQILHLRGLSRDGVCGISVIAEHREGLGLAWATERYGQRMFAGHARPSGVFEAPFEMDADSETRFLEGWRANYSDGGQGGTAILQNGMTFKPVSVLSATDQQYLESRKFQRVEIASMFRVPAHKLGDLERSTHSNIEEANREFLTDTLLPWLRRWEGVIAQQLLSEAEQETHAVNFVVDGLLRGNVERRFASYQIGIQNGFMSANEVRLLENMNPREGGDEYLRPLNMTPSDGAPAGDSVESERSSLRLVDTGGRNA